MSIQHAIQRFTIDRVSTPIGFMLIAVDSEARLRALDWSDYEDRMHRLLRLHYGVGGSELIAGRAPATVREPLERYVAGEISAIDAISVHTGGTQFQREVWAALRAIPVGETTSYSALAAKIGRPAAVRAVGMANGANPVGVVVPCHRVIGANGALAGFAGGVERKRWLLMHEGALGAPRTGTLL